MKNIACAILSVGISFTTIYHSCHRRDDERINVLGETLIASLAAFGVFFF